MYVLNSKKEQEKKKKKLIQCFIDRETILQTHTCNRFTKSRLC